MESPADLSTSLYVTRTVVGLASLALAAYTAAAVPRLRRIPSLAALSLWLAVALGIYGVWFLVLGLFRVRASAAVSFASHLILIATWWVFAFGWITWTWKMATEIDERIDPK